MNRYIPANTKAGRSLISPGREHYLSDIPKEIREHNEMVERKRQEKKNKKYLKHIQIAAPKVFPTPEVTEPTQGNLS